MIKDVGHIDMQNFPTVLSDVVFMYSEPLMHWSEGHTKLEAQDNSLYQCMNEYQELLKDLDTTGKQLVI